MLTAGMKKMATLPGLHERFFHEQIMTKDETIQGIFEDIRAGKYFGPEALSRAYDAGIKAAADTLPAQPIRAEAEHKGKAVAWLIVRYGSTTHPQLEIVKSPLTDDVYMDEGDEAWPMYAPFQVPERATSPRSFTPCGKCVAPKDCEKNGCFPPVLTSPRCAYLEAPCAAPQACADNGMCMANPEPNAPT